MVRCCTIVRRFFKYKFRRTASPKTSDSQLSTTQTAKPVSEGLHRLFPADESQSSPPGQQQHPVDIIAVHGLNGYAYSTWTHKPDGTLWLRDLLPSILPGCRVYTYSYPSKIFSESFARVHDFARGLLVDIRDLQVGSQMALVLAHQEDELYGKVLKSVLGVAFLGTPHRGSDIASFGNVMGTIINAFATAGARPRAVRSDLLEHLSSHSNELQDLIMAARGRLQNLAVVSFHELNPTSPLSSLIVDRTSATLGVAHEELIPMYEDHRSICRFASETNSYKKLANAIRRIASQSPDLSPPLRRASTHSSNRIKHRCTGQSILYSVKELLNRKGCKADQMDNFMATPFFWAVGGGHLAIISTLGKNPTVNVNHQDKDGRTAISWAAGDGMDDDVLRLLLRLPGIDPNLKDKAGKSPLSWVLPTVALLPLL
ncbi:hypothetical protein ACHAQJ_009883 [Trichoderma viride]